MRGCISVVIGSLAFSLWPAAAGADIEVQGVSFGYNNSWSGNVWIRIGADGEMYFADGAAGTSLSLEALTTSPNSGITTDAADSRYVNTTSNEFMTGNLTLQGDTATFTVDPSNGSGSIVIDCASGGTAGITLYGNSSAYYTLMYDDTLNLLRLYDESNLGDTLQIDYSAGTVKWLNAGSELWVLLSTGATSQTGNIYIDPGSETNQFIYVFEDGSSTGEYVEWDNTNDRWILSDDLNLPAGSKFTITQTGATYPDDWYVSPASYWDSSVTFPDATAGTGTISVTGLSMGTNGGEYGIRFPFGVTSNGGTVVIDQIAILGGFDANDYITSTAIWAYYPVGGDYYYEYAEDTTDANDTSWSNRLSADFTMVAAYHYWFCVRFTRGTADASLSSVRFSYHKE